MIVKYLSLRSAVWSLRISFNATLLHATRSKVALKLIRSDHTAERRERDISQSLLVGVTYGV